MNRLSLTSVSSQRRFLFFFIPALFPFIAVAEDTTDVGKIVVESNAPGNGLIIQEDTPKARSTVTRAAIEQKSSLNNSFQLINLLPGVNSYSQDATGLFGGGVRMRGFSSDQLGITIDGAPVNDAGNFAVYPQEFGDPENLQEIFITQGATDTDAPHIGASGGNIGLVTSSPIDKSRVRLQQTFGSNNASKTFLRADTGYVFDGSLKSFVSYSEAKADKWKGAGSADRKHLDFKSVLNLESGSSLTAGLLWNRTFTHNLRTLTLAQINTLSSNADFGTVAPQHLTSIGGAAVTEVIPANRYFNLNLNPFENYIATLKGNFQLTPALRLDVEPYYWYGYGTGGDELRTLAESNAASKFGGGIRDINGNGNTLDTVMIYSGAVTQTHRPGVTVRVSSQIDNHKLMAGLWYEHSRHRRTQPAVAFNNTGASVDPWLQNSANYLLRQDGTPYQGRDFLTVSTSRSLFVQDGISLMNDKLNLVLGLRHTGINRDFTNFASEGAGAYYNIRKDYFKTLPSLSACYQFNNEQQLFFNVAENFRAPPDSIYYGLINGGTYVGGKLTGYTLNSVNVAAETSTNWDVGYRYAGNDLTASGSLFYIDFRNRIATGYDPINLINTNYNVGNSATKGLELESAWRFQPKWSVYGSLTYTRSLMLQNLATGINTFEATAGKQFPDVPNWMAGAALQYRDGPWSTSLSAKYTGRRYSTLVNDEAVSGFTLFSLDAGYHLPSVAMFRDPTLRFNVYNLLNTNYLYLNALSTFTTRAVGAGGVAPAYYVGAPRMVSLMLSADL
ncbi:MAG: TonB-dependent receptor [Gallionella sp.]|jgi:iron complex outermembrane receptor protein